MSSEEPQPKYVVYDGEALGGPVYRVVANCPPTEDDFRSYAEIGRSFPTYRWFRATGVSFFLTRETAEKAMARYDLGGAIAELDLRDNRILWANTGGGKGHISAWATPAAFLTFVTNCT